MLGPLPGHEPLSRQLAFGERRRHGAAGLAGMAAVAEATRLGELLAQAAEVSVGADTTSDLGSAVDDVVTQLESLRLAVEDLNTPSTGSAGQPPAPP